MTLHNAINDTSDCLATLFCIFLSAISWEFILCTPSDSGEWTRWTGINLKNPDLEDQTSKAQMVMRKKAWCFFCKKRRLLRCTFACCKPLLLKFYLMVLKHLQHWLNATSKPSMKVERVKKSLSESTGPWEDICCFSKSNWGSKIFSFLVVFCSSDSVNVLLLLESFTYNLW